MLACFPGASSDLLHAFEMEQQNGTNDSEITATTQARLRFVREYRLHGTITGLQRIQTIDTARDGLDRLLVSFKNAKVRRMPVVVVEHPEIIH